jgi:hypothetical protein
LGDLMIDIPENNVVGWHSHLFSEGHKPR